MWLPHTAPSTNFFIIHYNSLAFTGNHLSKAKQWELSVIIVTSLCIAKHS